MAARNILTPYNFNKNEIQNVVAQNLASAPGTPLAGQFYYDTGTGKFMWRNASAWVDPLARAGHTGTQLASTISDFDTQVRTSTLNQMAAATADLSIGQKLTNVTDGTSAQDAATYGQLLSVQNGRDFKDSVRGATTVNDTLSGLAARDGITPIAGDRWLVQAQTTATANGIYVAAAGAWARSTDADTSAKVTANMSVMVEEGTVNADKQFTLTTNAPVVLGTTNLVFAVTGAGTTYTEGTGIDIAGSVISVDTAVVVRKFAQSIGDNSATSIAVTHSLGTLDVELQVYEVSSGATVECDMIRTSTSVATFVFTVAPTTNQYRAVVQG